MKKINNSTNERVSYDDEGEVKKKKENIKKNLSSKSKDKKTNSN